MLDKLDMNIYEQPCPECGQDYCGLSLESSRELGVSVISCSECTWRFSDECCEEDLVDKFKEKYGKPKGKPFRIKSVEFDDEGRCKITPDPKTHKKST